MLEEKNTYTIQELFEELPLTLTDLSRQCGINEVTLARIRDGKPTRRSTLNKLLIALSNVYGRPLSVRNVTGANVQVNKRTEKKQQKAGQEARS